MARVISVEENELGEVTEAVIMKGSTGEKLRRHATSLIPLLQAEETSEASLWESSKNTEDLLIKLNAKPVRKAATKAKARNKQLFTKLLA